MEDDDQSYDQDKVYSIEKISQQVSRKFGVEEYTLQAKFNNDTLQGARLDNVTDEIQSMFEDVVHEIEQQYDEDDRIRLAIDHAGMDRPMTIHLQPRRNVTAENIMNRYVNHLSYISVIFTRKYFTYTANRTKNLVGTLCTIKAEFN
jgi:hypothetical protein